MAALTGGMLLAVSALTMIGWLLRVPWMVQIIPGTVPMVFSNALCIFLLGVALLLSPVAKRWCRALQTAIGAIVLSIGAVVTAQYPLNFPLPLDLVELHHWLNANPGRMAPNTALAHVVAGVTVLFAAYARPGLRALPVIVGAFIVMMVGVTGLVGYWLRPELWYGWNIEQRMALHTGAAFLLFGFGYGAVAYRAQRLDELFRRREDLRVSLLGGGLMLFVGLVGGLVAFTLMQEQMGNVLRNGLQLSFQSRYDLVTSEVTALIRSSRDFADRVGIERELLRLRARPGDPAALRFLETSLNRHVKEGLNSTRIFNAEGRLLTHAGPPLVAGLELPLKLPSGAVIVWDGRTVSLRDTQPVFSKQLRIGRIETTYALPGVTRMLQDVELVGASGETQLCTRQAQAIRCLPMRLAPQRTELPETTRAGRTLIARALADEYGAGFETDYRGERVMTVYGPIGDLGLGMVLKVDAVDIYAPVRQRFEQIVPLIVLIIGAGILLLRARVVPLVRRLTLSERRFRGVLEAAPDAMVVTDLEGRIVWVNSRTERMFGYAASQLVGQAIEILVPERLRQRHVAQRSGYAENPKARTIGSEFQLQGRRKDGSEFPVEIGLSPQETENGTQVIGTVRDISERQRAVQALRNSEQRWQFALEGAREGVWDWNLATNEVFYSRQWKRMLGFEEHEIGGTLDEWDKRVHPDDKAAAYVDIEKHLKGEMPYYQNEHRVLCKDGAYVWILDRGMIVERDANGKATRMIGTHTDISTQKQAEETIQRLSLVDELTGLRNRRGLMVLGESQLSLARRLGREVVVFFFDLDGLKRINDELGHAEGDHALADFASVLRATFRESDLIARLGGDEFVVLSLEAPEVDTDASVSRFEEQLRAFNRSEKRRYRLAASIGVAQRAPDSAESFGVLIDRADAAMYEVKQRHRAAR